MKKYVCFLVLFCFINCKNQRIENCLGNEEAQLFKEGRNIFEDIINEFYLNDKQEEVYKSYFKDLTIGSENLKILESDFRALKFIEKLKNLNKIDSFWRKEKRKEFPLVDYRERYFINKGKYLQCLKQIYKTKEFKVFFSELEEENAETSAATLASSLLVVKSSVMENDNELLRFYVAFHFYFESILNNEQKR